MVNHVSASTHSDHTPLHLASSLGPAREPGHDDGQGGNHDSNSDVTLHEYISEKNWNNVLHLLQTQPNLVSRKGDSGALPIHLAAGNGAPLDIIDKLLDVYPDGATVKNNYGSLPLHRAAASGATLEVVARLIEAFPDGVKETTNGWSLPLHFAVTCRAPVNVVKRLLDSYPDAVRQKDRSGNLPVHTAAANKATVQVVSMLVDLYPGGVQEKNNVHDLPLHLAAAFGSDVDVISRLIGTHPASVRDKGEHGNLALHLAAAGGQSHDVITRLVTEYPDGVHKINNNGKTPLEMCTGKRRSSEVVRILSEATMRVDGSDLEGEAVDAKRRKVGAQKAEAAHRGNEDGDDRQIPLFERVVTVILKGLDEAKTEEDRKSIRVALTSVSQDNVADIANHVVIPDDPSSVSSEALYHKAYAISILFRKRSEEAA
ncbi:hypothetical protein RI054_07g40080 [Pseudoscourfieldia marina]